MAISFLSLRDRRLQEPLVAVGKSVSHLHEGDRVAWCSILGTYAEYAVAPAERGRNDSDWSQLRTSGRRLAARHELLITYHTLPTLSSRGMRC